MTNPGAMRARYLADSIATASPARLLIMLYDRLVLDLTQGEEAIRAGDRGAASDRLMHAQDIIAELLATLDPTAWDGAEGLAALYRFLLQELVQANIKQDAGRAGACRELVEPLRDAWRDAALALGGAPTGGG
jgi:flagellar protein FliS